MGTSFGGGIGAMLLPWDERIKKAKLDVPSFGNHPLRLQVPCVGSGESVRLYWQNHPEVTEVLRFYDSAIHSRFTRIPVLVAAALFDPAVCPQGQFSIYNALSGPKELVVRQADHFEFPEKSVDDMQVYRRTSAWFEN
jgi:cephalosporin-C deacetylase